MREYWDGLDEALPNLEGVERTAPKHVSLTDPASAWSIKHGPGRLAYGLNAVVDTASGIVLDVEAAPARLGDEPKASRVMAIALENAGAERGGACAVGSGGGEHGAKGSAGEVARARRRPGL